MFDELNEFSLIKKNINAEKILFKEKKLKEAKERELKFNRWEMGYLRRIGEKKKKNLKMSFELQRQNQFHTSFKAKV
jgi:hypothetical protein